MNLQLFASRKATDARAGKGEPREKFVRRLTHLRLQECGLSEIEHLDATRKLQVLYLNSNRLTVLRGLQHAALCSLIQLDLHDNDIAVMEGRRADGAAAAVAGAQQDHVRRRTGGLHQPAVAGRLGAARGR